MNYLSLKTRNILPHFNFNFNSNYLHGSCIVQIVLSAYHLLSIDLQMSARSFPQIYSCYWSSSSKQALIVNLIDRVNLRSSAHFLETFLTLIMTKVCRDLYSSIIKSIHLSFRSPSSSNIFFQWRSEYSKKFLQKPLHTVNY